jgi:hypothetical protein
MIFDANSNQQMFQDNFSMCGRLVNGGVPALMLVVVLAGCSSSDKPSLAEVNGTLTKGGKPFVDAALEFYPEGMGGTSYGTTDSAGNFKLNYSTGEPGAAVGKHTVKVIGGRVAGAPAPAAPTIPPDADGSEVVLAPVAAPSKATPGSGPQEPVMLTAEILADTINTITLNMP